MSIIERMRKVYRFLRDYGQHFPRAFGSIFYWRCYVKLLEGRPHRDGPRVAVLYAGRGQNLAYLAKTIFEDQRIRNEARTWVFRWRHVADRWLKQADLLVVDIGWPYHYRINRQGDFLEVPDWVDMGVEIEGAWEDVARRFRRDARRNDLRRIRRAGYRCEITSDRAEIARFYDEMYAPYARFAHGDDALLAPRWHVIRQGAKGALIKVVDSREVLAAGVAFPAGNVLVSLWMGLPRHLHDDPPNAVISALYVFLIRYAIDHGYGYVDFAGTRSFLEDGVFQFKRKWGAEVDDCFSPSSILLQMRNAERRTIDLVERLPVFTRGADGLEAVIVSTASQDHTERLQTVERRYGIPGLQRVHIMVADGSRDTDQRGTGESGIEYRIRSVDSGAVPAAYCSRWIRKEDDGPAKSPVLSKETRDAR